MTAGSLIFHSVLRQCDSLRSGLPQDCGLGSVLDDHTKSLRTNSACDQVSQHNGVAATLKKEDLSNVVSADEVNSHDWIEVSKSKGKKKR
jgi:hypothetical protein